MSEVSTARPPNMKKDIAPLRIAFDESCGHVLRMVLTESRSLFVETDPAAADAVIFGTDMVDYIQNSALYQAFTNKSVCITESDTPTFRLPGLYAASSRSFLTKSRCRSISYFISERERGNPEVRRLIGQAHEKRYLYSFMGGTNSWARKRLFKHVHSTVDTVVEATDLYNHWDDEKQRRLEGAKQQFRYATIMAASKFALCPRGCGLSSYRLFESMSLGIAPVIISDDWRPINGVDWHFALFVREQQIPRIDSIVRSHADEWAERGAVAAKTYRDHFAEGAITATLHRELTAVLNEVNPARERVIAPVTRLRAAWRKAYWAGYKAAKLSVLLGFHVCGLPVPIKLHQTVEEQLRNAALIPARHEKPRP